MTYILDSVISIIALGAVGLAIGIAKSALRRYPNDS